MVNFAPPYDDPGKPPATSAPLGRSRGPLLPPGGDCSRIITVGSVTLGICCPGRGVQSSPEKFSAGQSRLGILKPDFLNGQIPQNEAEN